MGEQLSGSGEQLGARLKGGMLASCQLQCNRKICVYEYFLIPIIANCTEKGTSKV